MTGGGTKQWQADPQSALRRLTDPFVAPKDLSSELIDARALPPWASELLVHREHMTTRLGARYGAPIRLAIIEEQRTEEAYARLVGLKPAEGEWIVEIGICRVQLGLVSEAVRADITAGKTPLGDILIRHEVMRTIEPRWYWRFDQGSALIRAFGEPARTGYGRVGVIHYGSSPAIEVLEVVCDPAGRA